MASEFLQPSFAAGEISPALYARVDLAKYSSGAALLRNWFVDYRGGINTRAGTEFIIQCKPNATGRPRLLPFSVSTEATYVLEFGDLYIRFIHDGVPVLEASKAIVSITQADPGEFEVTAHGYSNGDEVFLSAITGMTELNNEYYLVIAATTDTFQLTTIQGEVIGTSSFEAYAGGGLVSRVYELESPYETADLPLLRYTQSADVLTLTHTSFPPYNLTRVTEITFSLDQIVIGSDMESPENVVGYQTNKTADNNYYAFVITAVSADGKDESAPSFPAIVTGDVLGEDETSDNANVINWDPSPDASSYRIYKVGPMPSRASTDAAPMATVFGYIGQSETTSFTDNHITADYSRTPPQFQDPFSPGQVANLTGAGGTGYTDDYIIALEFTGDGTGAAGYGLIDPNTDEIIGAVLTNPGKGYTVAPTVTDDNGSATYVATLGQLSGTYPACVTYFQQRRTFGGTPNFPESIVLSKPGLYENFDTSAVSQATDGITISMASREVNFIQSMIAMPTGLVVFTTGGGFLVSGGNPGAAITPGDVTALPQATPGANAMPSLQINTSILYTQARGSVVRDLSFNFYSQSYVGTDRSVLASHLFSGHFLEEWTYAEEPFRLIQVVRDDGKLLTFTYVPEQEIYAWTQYDTNGLFRSIAQVVEGLENAVYVIVQRTVEGEQRYYIERFVSRLWKYLPDAWAVDSSLKLPEVYPAADITLSGVTGDIIVTASAAVFASGNVGDVLWAGGGRATITGFTNSTHLTATVIDDFPVILNDPVDTPESFAEGDWTLDVPHTGITGLTHLEGMYCVGLADGMPVPAQLIENGTFTLPQPATKVVVGLAFQAQMQTLRLETEPSIQGKRKSIVAVTTIVNNSLGLKVGPTFSSLTEMKDLLVPYTPPIRWVTGLPRTIVTAWWREEGQLCYQMDAPLPATILGIIPEMVIGDTIR